MSQAYLSLTGNSADCPVETLAATNWRFTVTKTSPAAVSVRTSSTTNDEFPTCNVFVRNVIGKIICALWWNSGEMLIDCLTGNCSPEIQGLFFQKISASKTIDIKTKMFPINF